MEELMLEYYLKGYTSINSLYNKIKEINENRAQSLSLREVEVGKEQVRVPKREEVASFILSTKTGQEFAPPTKGNHYIGHYPFEQWSVDIAFFGTIMILLAVDNFTRELQGVEIHNKNKESLIKGFEALIKKFGKQPESIYSDMESGIASQDFQDWLAEKKIKGIFSRAGHAVFIESQIGHLKQALKRMTEARKEAEQTQGKIVDNVLSLIDIHNKTAVNRQTKMTPEQAKTDHLQARINMLSYAIANNWKKKPVNEFDVGDKVLIRVKKNATDKPSSIPHYAGPYKITEKGGNGYIVRGKTYQAQELRLYNEVKPINDDADYTINFEKPAQTMANKKELAHVRNDPDSTFEPATGKRRQQQHQ